ncbi:amino acid adenylation domain-containing protein, partial [Pyxidicoccus fallax]
AVQSYRGATLSRLMPATVSKALQALCQREGVTSFMALLAGFQALLSRYSGQTDVVVGTDIAGRTHADTEGLIGFFVNQLVMRGDLSGDPTFRELLGRTRQVALGAYAHQDVPFEELVRVLNPERSLAHAPLFQVKLALQNAPATELKLPGLALRSVESDTGTAKFDLTLSIQETPEGLACLADYSTDLFDADTMARMLEHLQVLMEAAVSRPDTRLSSLPLLTEAERRQLLVEWNDTATDFPAEACIHHLFEQQVARTPDAPALGFEDAWLTYRELDARANQLAWHLRSLGVGPEVRVGLCAERSLELVVGLFAILKAGGAYVPLDPSYPRERLAWMLEDARPAVLVAQPSLLARLPETLGARVVSLDDASLRALPTHAPAPLATPDSLAYVLFTSGSTGRPKGVQVPHRTVSNFFTGMDAHLARPPHAAWLAVTRLSFDISVLELLWTLARGFRVLLQADTLSPDWLPRAVRQHAITHLQCTPSLARALLLDSASAEALRSLQQLLVGGEALPLEVARQLRERVPSVLNMYGPTETTVWSSCFALPAQPSVVSLGRPIANTRLYVLDSHLRPLPVGVPGELFIGGAGVVRGYLGRPELTAERFIPDPFASTPGERLYRTGDQVRRLADGGLEYLGRLDFQVKVRGFRIELGEIEAALEQHPRVRQAVVVAREDVAGDKRLVAYVVPPSGAQAPDASALREALKQQLPEYMVPSAFVALEALPLTFNGKLDRKALPAPDGALSARVEYVAPRSETEQKLASLWSEVLRVERIGIHDNFFELGGHSLLATQVASRIRTSFGVEVPLPTLFEATTLEMLARAVETSIRSKRALALPPLRPVERTDALPLSFAQQRLWFLDQLIPDSALYNMPAPLRLEGSLDVAALERSLSELMRRHEVLRTSFPADADQPLQVIAPPAPFPLERVDLSALSAEAREAEARRLVEAECRKPFSLAHGPLLRALLLKLEAQQHVLVLNMHHIISDGWSTGVVVREVAALYEAFSQGQSSPLPELPVQYADFAAWQRQWLQGEALEAQFSYWRQQLAGAPR